MRKNKNSAACWLMGIAQGVLLVAMAGCAQQPVTAAIAANGGYVGQAELGGAFYRDVPPGHYLVTVQTVGIDTNQTANFDLPAGQEAYVKIVSLPSWETGGDKSQWEKPTFYAWRIPNQVAQADVAHLS